MCFTEYYKGIIFIILVMFLPAALLFTASSSTSSCVINAARVFASFKKKTPTSLCVGNEVVEGKCPIGGVKFSSQPEKNRVKH